MTLLLCLLAVREQQWLILVVNSNGGLVKQNLLVDLNLNVLVEFIKGRSIEHRVFAFHVPFMFDLLMNVHVTEITGCSNTAQDTIATHPGTVVAMVTPVRNGHVGIFLIIVVTAGSCTCSTWGAHVMMMVLIGHGGTRCGWFGQPVHNLQGS